MFAWRYQPLWKWNLPTKIYKVILPSRTVKKIIAILLISVYSVSTLGLSLKSFYCCGELKSVTVSITQHEQQKCTNDDGMSDCCKTKYQFFKVKDNHVAGDVISTPLLHHINLHLFSSSFPIINHISQEIYSVNLSNSPPPFHSVPNYIFNCVFRIWFFFSLSDKAFVSHSKSILYLIYYYFVSVFLQYWL